MTTTTSTANLFETASREAFRFESPRGLLTVEDLWNLPLTHKSQSVITLDSVAKLANRDVKQAEEESFVADKTPENTKLTLKLELIKHIISVKKAENEAAQVAKEKAVRRQQLTEALASKREDAIKGMSEEDILKELQAL